MTDDERPADRTLALPTVATTAAADELGAEVDAMLAAYHGYPVNRARPKSDPAPTGSKPPPVPGPAELVSRPAIAARTVTTGARYEEEARRRGWRRHVAWTGRELRAHPLRLALIILLSVPAGTVIGHAIVPAAPHVAPPAGGTRAVPATTPTPTPDRPLRHRAHPLPAPTTTYRPAPRLSERATRHASPSPTATHTSHHPSVSPRPSRTKHSPPAVSPPPPPPPSHPEVSPS